MRWIFLNLFCIRGKTLFSKDKLSPPFINTFHVVKLLQCDYGNLCVPLYVVLSKANSISAGVCQYVDMYYSHVAKPFLSLGWRKKSGHTRLGAYGIYVNTSCMEYMALSAVLQVS